MKKLLLSVYLVFIVGLVGLRCYIQATLLESGVGFYSGPSIWIDLQNWGLIAAVVVLFLLPFFVFSPRQEKAPPSRGAGVMLTLTALVLFVANVWQTYSRLSSTQEKLVKLLPELLLWGAGILSALIFLLAGLALLRGTFRARGFSLALFVPTFWMIGEVIFYFVRYTASLTISKQLFEIMLYVASALFLLGHVGVLCNINTKKSLRYTVCGGFIGSLFAFLLLVPNLYVVFSGQHNQISCGIGDALLFLTLGGYEMAFALYALFTSRAKKRQLAADNGEDELVLDLPGGATPIFPSEGE